MIWSIPIISHMLTLTTHGTPTMHVPSIFPGCKRHNTGVPRRRCMTWDDSPNNRDGTAILSRSRGDSRWMSLPSRIQVNNKGFKCGFSFFLFELLQVFYLEEPLAKPPPTSGPVASQRAMPPRNWSARPPETPENFGFGLHLATNDLRHPSPHGQTRLFFHELRIVISCCSSFTGSENSISGGSISFRRICFLAALRMPNNRQSSTWNMLDACGGCVTSRTRRLASIRKTSAEHCNCRKTGLPAFPCTQEVLATPRPPEWTLPQDNYEKSRRSHKENGKFHIQNFWIFKISKFQINSFRFESKFHIHIQNFKFRFEFQISIFRSIPFRIPSMDRRAQSGSGVQWPRWTG